jgi:alkylation response protein AidB-like acyl-CoA dehydrogenase
VRLHYDDSTERFRAELDEWLDEYLPPCDEKRERPQSSAHIPEWARRWQRSLFDAGWLVPGWPPELGGRNATPVQQMVYFEELARRQIWRSHNIQGLSIFAPSVIDFGTEEQKQQWALPVLRAEKTTCLGMSEPGAGSDLAGLSTRAEVRGDNFVINGQKVWTSGAHHADFCICFVRTDPAVPKHRGISVLLLEMSTPGITVRPLPSLVDRTSWVDFNEVFFDDVVVPRENLLGELNDGWRVANASLGHERGMLWVWESARLDRALELAVDEARRTDTTGHRLGERAGLRSSLADAYVDALALRCLGYRGFAKFARGRAAPEHMLLKLFGSEANQKLFLGFTEGLGAAALDVETPDDAMRMDDNWPWVNRYLASFGTTISGGTSEIQRNIIAERVLGLPR